MNWTVKMEMGHVRQGREREMRRRERGILTQRHWAGDMLSIGRLL